MRYGHARQRCPTCSSLCDICVELITRAAQYVERDIARARRAAERDAPELVKLRPYFDHPLFVEMFATPSPRPPQPCAVMPGWCPPRIRSRRPPTAAGPNTLQPPSRLRHKAGRVLPDAATLTWPGGEIGPATEFTRKLEPDVTDSSPVWLGPKASTLIILSWIRHKPYRGGEVGSRPRGALQARQRASRTPGPAPPMPDP